MFLIFFFFSNRDHESFLPNWRFKSENEIQEGTAVSSPCVFMSKKRVVFFLLFSSVFSNEKIPQKQQEKQLTHRGEVKILLEHATSDL